MSEDLETARRMAMESEASDPTNLYCLLQSVWHLIFYLEAQEEQMQATAAQHRHQHGAPWGKEMTGPALPPPAEPLPETPPSLESSATMNSSVPTHGPATKPSEWFTGMHAADGGNLQDVPGWLKQAIMDFSKSMPLHTGISFLARTPTSLTLQLTWQSPMQSTVTRAGVRGGVDHE